jgi:hypothetical protein
MSYRPRSSTSKYYVEDSFAMIKLLMDRGVDFNSMTNERRNFFHVFLTERNNHDGRIIIYRPHDMLTAVLVRVIEGGGDILAVEMFGKTPTDAAKDNHYDRSWREALSRCGYSPQDVYAKSGVSWTELKNCGPEANLIETLEYMGRQWYHEQSYGIPGHGRQWRQETLQQLLTSGVQTYGDLFLQVDSQTTTEILQVVRKVHADDAFRKALATCGYNAKQIYNCADIPWVELEDILFCDAFDAAMLQSQRRRF